MERLLAFADLVEVLPGWVEVRFDTLSAADYHRLPFGRNVLMQTPTLRTRLVEFQANEAQLRRLARLSERAGEFPIEEDSWYEIELEGDREFGVAAQVYSSVVAGEVELSRVTGIGFLDGSTQRDLQDRFSLGSVPDSDETGIKQVLAQIGGVFDMVACYNVGQGGCSAVCSQAQPILYFDLGGGVTANAKTYPNGFQVCHTALQPIVLSHWDMDHWSTASRDLRALDHPWLVPRQAIGPTHLSLAARLHAKGKLLIWPTGHPSISTGGLALALCQGGSRNNSGLALTVTLPSSEVILLPGDASYAVIPGLGSYDGLAASHHGGNGVGHPPKAKGRGQVAYSYGVSNTYSHPRWQAINQHHRAGWRRRLDTPNGNILLGPAPPQLPVHPPCGSQCSLKLVQS